MSSNRGLEEALHNAATVQISSLEKPPWRNNVIENFLPDLQPMAIKQQPMAAGEEKIISPWMQSISQKFRDG
jgi:hypothetical protein